MNKIWEHYTLLNLDILESEDVILVDEREEYHMSWDVVLIRTKSNDESVNEIDTDNMILFKQIEIAKEIKRIASLVSARYNCDDLAWPTMEANKWSIEFYVGDDEETESVMLGIRGSEEPTEVLKELAEGLNTRLYDCSSGEFMEFDIPSRFADWKAYRDKVILGRKE